MTQNDIIQQAIEWTGYQLNNPIQWNNQWHKPFENDKISVKASPNQSLLILKDHSTGKSKTFRINPTKQKYPHLKITKTAPTLISRTNTNTLKELKSLPIATNNHPYLINKKVTLPQSTKKIKTNDKNELIVPCISIQNGQIVSYQRILPHFDTKNKKWPKFFKSNSPHGQGVYFLIPPANNKTAQPTPTHQPPLDTIIICEGLSTALSIHHITKKAVVIAFSRTKLDTITSHIQKELQPTQTIIANDNDGPNTHKTKLKNVITTCPYKKGDFNDYQHNPAEIRKLQKLTNTLPHFIPNADKVAELQSKLNALNIKVRFNTRTKKPEINGLENIQWTEIDDQAHFALYFETLLLKSKKSPLMKNKQQIQQQIQQKMINNPDYKPNQNETFFLSIAQKLNPKHKTPSIETFNNSLKALFHYNKTDPFQQYLTNLKWDKKPRLENYLSDIFHVKPDHLPIAKWAFKSIFLGAVWRTFQPGTKHDEMVILHSPQGVGKSQILAELVPFPDLFTNSLKFSDKNKDMVHDILGKALVEVAELSGFRKSDLNTMKNFISTQIDTVRLSYNRYTNSYPRTCIIIGTTNDENPLPADLTGLRRWQMVSIARKFKSNLTLIQKIKEERNQLWAEATHLYRKGESARLPQNLWEVSAKISEEYRGGDRAFEELFKKEMTKVINNIQKGSGKQYLRIPYTLKYLKDGREDSYEDNQGKQQYTKEGGGWIKNISVNYQMMAVGILKKEGWHNTLIREGQDVFKAWLPPKSSYSAGQTTFLADQKLDDPPF